MDPDASWSKLLHCVSENQWDDAAESADALQSWIHNDGFPPLISVGTTSGRLRCNVEKLTAKIIVLAVCQDVIHSAREKTGSL